MGYSILIVLVDSFSLFSSYKVILFVLVHVLPGHCIVPCQAHRNGGWCHSTSSHNLVQGNNEVFSPVVEKAGF